MTRLQFQRKMKSEEDREAEVKILTGIILALFCSLSVR